MNNVLGKLGACVGLLIVAGTVVIAKDWRGIVPLKSTRADVERLLGRPKRSSGAAAYYKLSNEIVVLRFQTAPCDMCGFGWNVPPGTVVGIGVIPRSKHRKDQYLLGSNSKVEDNGAGFVYYSDHSAGYSLETYKNLVTHIDYYPEASQDNLRCPRVQECIIDFFSRFDEYQNLSFEDEKARLDNFLISMNEDFGRGTIEVLGPSKRIRQQRMKLATRAKRHLVKQRGFEAERLLLVDGGFNKSALTRLSMYAIGGLGSRVYLFPEEDP